MDNLDKDRVIDARLIESDDGAQHNTAHQIPTEPTTLIQEETKRWAVLLHLSTLLGLVSFGFGLIVPIVIWQWKKPELPAIDAHGKVVANAIVSYIIWGAIALPLCLLVIGFFLLWILGILAVVFPIIAALKARDGELWDYPLCFKFFR